MDVITPPLQMSGRVKNKEGVTPSHCKGIRESGRTVGVYATKADEVTLT